MDRWRQRCPRKRLLDVIKCRSTVYGKMAWSMVSGGCILGEIMRGVIRRTDAGRSDCRRGLCEIRRRTNLRVPLWLLLITRSGGGERSGRRWCIGTQRNHLASRIGMNILSCWNKVVRTTLIVKRRTVIAAKMWWASGVILWASGVSVHLVSRARIEGTHRWSVWTTNRWFCSTMEGRIGAVWHVLQALVRMSLVLSAWHYRMRMVVTVGRGPRPLTLSFCRLEAAACVTVNFRWLRQGVRVSIIVPLLAMRVMILRGHVWLSCFPCRRWTDCRRMVPVNQWILIGHEMRVVLVAFTISTTIQSLWLEATPPLTFTCRGPNSAAGSVSGVVTWPVGIAGHRCKAAAFCWNCFFLVVSGVLLSDVGAGEFPSFFVQPFWLVKSVVFIRVRFFVLHGIVWIRSSIGLWLHICKQTSGRCAVETE